MAPKPKRLRRWIVRIVLGLLSLVVILVVTALIVAAHLDWGPVKRFALGKAHAQGIDADYDQASVSLGGVHLRGVRVHSPAADAALAPDLVSIGAIDGDWSPFHKRLDSLVIKDVVLTVVVNDDGTTSIDHFLAGLPPSGPSPPAKPLSSLLDGILPTGIEAHARIEHITVRVVPQSPKAGQAITFEGLTAIADLANGKLGLSLGPADLRLAVGDKTATAHLEASVALAGPQVKASFSLVLGDENIALPPGWTPGSPLPLKQVVDLAVVADFVPAEHRVHVQVDKFQLADGKAAFDLQADLFDGPTMRPVIHSANGTIDLAAIVKVLPPGLLGPDPIVVEAEPLKISAREFELQPTPKGDLAITGKVSHIIYKDIEVRGMALDVGLHPADGKIVAKIAMPVDSVTMTGLKVAELDLKLDLKSAGGATGFPALVVGTIFVGSVDQPGQQLRKVGLLVDGTLASPTSFDGNVALDVARAATPTLVVERARVEANLLGFALAPIPLESTGIIKARGTVGAVAQGPSTKARDASFTAEAHLAGKAPITASLVFDAANLTVPQLPSGKAHVELAATDVQIDAANPAKSRGAATFAAAFAGGTIAGSASGSAADVSWDIHGTVAQAGPARGIKLASKGRYGGDIDHDTAIEVASLAQSGNVVHGAHVHIASKGNLRHQDATIGFTASEVNVRGHSVGAINLDVTAAVDLDKPQADLRIRGKSPDTDLHLVASVDADHTLRWDTDGHVGKLGPFAPLLPQGPAWDQLSLQIKGHGALSGVVRSVTNGIPTLAANPLLTARGKGDLEIDVRGVRYTGANEMSATVDALTLKADVDLADTSKKANVDLDVPALTAVTSGVNVAVEGFTLHLDADLDKGGAGQTQLAIHAKSIKQSAFAAYPVRDLEMDVKLIGDPKQSMTIEASLDNPGAGTSLDLNGQVDQRVLPGADVIPDRRSLAVDGRLEQSLDALDSMPDQLKASGRITIPFRVESGDLTMFRASAVAKLEKVNLTLYGANGAKGGASTVVEDANGELPIVEEIVGGPAGYHPVGKGELGLYPQLRFGDQQPFLGGTNYLSIARLQIGKASLGPLAGNLRIDHDVVALDQLEMSALGGKITGQCLATVAGRDTSISFRGKVTGIKPTDGPDVLDANAALTLTPYQYGLEGRIEMVRIGRQHLYDLLDLLDPYHAMVAANRVRLGLHVGYPKQVRLSFLHGFAGASIELGGVAGLVRIDDLTGIPIGPALARYLAPVLEKK